MEDIDDYVETLNSREERKLNRQAAAQAPQGPAKARVGSVEMFFSKIGVAAIALEAPLKVGDIIEIGTEDDAVRLRVASMQIDRADVLEAGPGDSVGIKVKYPVQKGSEVCKVGE
jgi:hypothetical protein